MRVISQHLSWTWRERAVWEDAWIEWWWFEWQFFLSQDHGIGPHLLWKRQNRMPGQGHWKGHWCKWLLQWKDVTRYLEGYKTRMWMMDIHVPRIFSSFARFVASNLHSRILEIQEGSSDRVTFELNLLEEYGFDDLFWMTRRDFMDCVESLRKNCV